MGLRIIILDSNGKELEIENKVIEDIIFESEEEIEFKNSLPLNFQYKVIGEKRVNKNDYGVMCYIMLTLIVQASKV
ncbi:hypothetical protein [Robertmurraya massiliosenegalensis]|uniref:hypothetical protein n=1 Tax=Robertmurraya massiliosenegalensis TaxID=1287657 RepID=UPI0002E3F9CB|nr:hypothetical protein [Robertmurraya massiliosenegalensis]